VTVVRPLQRVEQSGVHTSVARSAAA